MRVLDMRPNVVADRCCLHRQTGVLSSRFVIELWKGVYVPLCARA